MSFERSLQPMLVWMRFIGVFLESPGRSPAASPWIRIGITCYGFLLFFGNVLSNGLQIAELEITSTYSSAAQLLILAVGTLNLAALTICSQLSLMSSSAVASKWPTLLRILCRMEKERFFESRDFSNFRRIFLRGTITFVVVFAVAVGGGIIVPVWTLDWPLARKCQVSFPAFCLIFVFSGGALFSCLGWMASSMLAILAQQVRHDADKSDVDTWRRRYHLISQLVDEISHCYGPLLLTLIATGYVQMIDSFYNMMYSVMNNCLACLMNECLLLATQVSFFLVLIYVPHRIRESAITFSKRLQCMERGPDKDDKIDILAMSVLSSLPKITAIGFFEVDLHLVPTLIGTTLTYLIILCQIHFNK